MDSAGTFGTKMSAHTQNRFNRVTNEREGFWRLYERVLPGSGDGGFKCCLHVRRGWIGAGTLAFRHGSRRGRCGTGGDDHRVEWRN